MIKIANITIIDTGYLRADIQGTAQAPQSNSGNPMELKSANMSYNGSGNVDTDPHINSNTIPIVNFGSVNANKWIINGVLDRRSASDMLLLPELDKLKSTYGIKLLYYSSTTDGYRDLTNTLGIVNKDDWHKGVFFSTTSTPHIHIRVGAFNIIQTTSTHFRYTLDIVETT